MLKVGDTAPDFELPAHDEQPVRLSRLLGAGPVVLYFYPKDHTSGCTIESCGFRDDFEAFRALDVQIFGVSADGAARHRSFREKYELPFPLLTDQGGRVASLYGVEKTLGLIPGRATFVVDRGGIVQLAFASQLRATEHVARALDVVRRL
jgi:thioredoxin-dependent peroxiredoxin